MLYKKFYHKKIVAIGDVHGNIKTLEALLKKIPKGMEVFFLGDLIDRGPASKEVVSLVKNKYKCLLGNHESFMVVEGHRKLCRYTSRWGKNGAKQTKKSYGGDWKIKNIPNLKKDYQDHRLWMKELPLVAHFPKIEVNGRELFLSHSSMDSAIKKSGSLENLIKILKEEKNFLMSYEGGENFKILDSIFWKVEKDNIKDMGIFNVFGHTIQDNAKIKEHYACIDTGACSENKLTALVLPEMKVIEQPFID